MVRFLPPEPGALLPSYGYDTSSNGNGLRGVNKRNCTEINPLLSDSPTRKYKLFPYVKCYKGFEH